MFRFIWLLALLILCAALPVRADVESTQRRIDTVKGEISAMIAEKAKDMEEYRNGEYCTECNRTRGQLIRDRVPEGPDEHFRKNSKDGRPQRPTAEQIAAREKTWDDKIGAKQRELDRLLVQLQGEKDAVERAAREAEQRRLEEQKRADEQKRLEDERKKAEQKRLDDEKKASEQKRLDDAKKLADQKRLDDERKRADDQKRKDDEKNRAEQKSKDDERKRADAKKEKDDERRLAEQERRDDARQRIEDQQRLDAQRQRREKADAEDRQRREQTAEEARQRREKAAADDAERQREAQQRAAEQRAEQAKIDAVRAEAARVEAERLHREETARQASIDAASAALLGGKKPAADTGANTSASGNAVGDLYAKLLDKRPVANDGASTAPKSGDAVQNAYNDLFKKPADNVTRLSDVKDYVLKNVTDKECNILVGTVAQRLGYEGFKVNSGGYMIADKMVSFMSTSKDWKSAAASDAISQANAGAFVLGGITSADTGSTNGHVFVVLPGSKDAENWRQMNVLEARHNQFAPRVTTGNWAIRADRWMKLAVDRRAMIYHGRWTALAAW